MEFSVVVVLVLALLLAVFEPGLSQQEGDDDLQVVTTQKALKKLIRKGIAKAFESTTVTCAAGSPASAPTSGLDEDVIARIEEKINAKFDSLEKKMNTLYKLGSAPHHSANSCAEIIENNICSLSGDYRPVRPTVCIVT